MNAKEIRVIKRIEEINRMREKKQKKNRKIHALLLAFGIGLFGVWNMCKPVAVYGAEESITSMDEEGNMKKVDSSAKLIENPAGPDKTRKGEPQVVNFRTKNNAVTEYIEQETAKPGYTNGAYGADAVYLGYANGKYKFMLSGVVGWVKEDEVQVVNLSQAKAVSCYEVKDGKLMHHIVQDMTTPGYATSLNNGPAPAYLEPGTLYYSYDGHYFYTDYGVMVSDYRNDQRTQSVNPEQPYYNYFQYLPMRSQSAYTGEELDEILEKTVKKDSKMKDTGKFFVDKQNTYGVHALLMTGIAANESNWGQSTICKQKNNLFGLNATDSDPGANANKYGSIAACIEDFANGWMSRGYLYPKDYRYNGGFLGNKASGLNVKYASDPYWGEKAANIVWRLDSIMGEKDAGAYTLAAKEIIPKEHISVNVRKESDTSSKSLYKTGKAANYVVLVRNPEPVNHFYEIQSDAVLNEQRTEIVKISGKYNFDTMYSYMSEDYLTIVHQKSESELVPPETEITPPENETTPPESGSQPQEETPEIQQVTLFVTPEAVEVQRGGTQQFGVEVRSKTGTMPELIWEVIGNKSQDTTISNDGLLAVGKEEISDKIIIRAALKEDASQTADAVAVITEAQEQNSETEPPEMPQQENPQVPETPQEQNPEMPQQEEPQAPETPPQDTDAQQQVVLEENQQVQNQNIAGEEVKNPETPDSKDTGKKEATNETSVKTGDETNLAVWVVLGILSVGMILFLSGKKQKD